jgi:hypothetical protein
VLDQRDLVGLHLVGIELEVELHPTVHQLGELGADTGVRQVDAHLYLLCFGPRGNHGKRGRYRDDLLDH